MEKLYVRTMDCYQKAPIEKRKKLQIGNETAFDLSVLPTQGIRRQMEAFLSDRGQTGTVGSIQWDLRSFRLLGRYLSEKKPEMESFEVHGKEMFKEEYRDWLAENGVSIVQARGEKQYQTQPLLFIDHIYQFLYPPNALSVKELSCFQTADDKQKKKLENRSFPLNRIPKEGLRAEFEAFIRYRGEIIQASSLRSEMWPCSQLIQFLAQRHPEMESLMQVSEDSLVKELKAWLLSRGARLASYRKRKESGAYKRVQADAVCYLGKMYAYLSSKGQEPQEVGDIWRLDEMDIPLWDNPASPVKNFNFSRILQEPFREEVKRVVKVMAACRSAATIVHSIQAASHFSAFLAENFPLIRSALEVAREPHIEAYLIERNARGGDYRSELANLKQLFSRIGLIYGCRRLEQLFYPDDMPRRSRRLVKAYSDGELERLNREIVQMDPQTARALMLHQMLGNRISETLQLARDCLQEDGTVAVYEQKTKKTCYKPASPDVVRLVKAAAEYSEQRYGPGRYLFVNDRAPQRPMQYAYLKYQVMCMIQAKGLKDDSGRLFGFGTHTMRHSFGCRLAEMGMDDKTIAALLGHSGTGSVANYRKISSETLAEQTRMLRDQMNGVLSRLQKEWSS